MRQEETPLLSQLKALAMGERLSFHMPANRGGKSFPTELSALFTRLETTELSSTDDLNRPEGPALEAEKLAAQYFGAGASLFFTSGSTTAIYAMLSAAVGAGGKVWADPCSHRSLAHIAAFLDLELEFLELLPTGDGRSPLPKADAKALERRLLRAPRDRRQAIYLTSPDYYGSTAEISRFAEIARNYEISLLVDEAHGACFAALPGEMPPTALSSGADMAVQSLHKTLPALAPASILHLSADALEREPVLLDAALKARPLFQSSSPSFPIAASIDYARKILATEGPRQLRRLIAELGELAKILPEGAKLLPALPGREDPTRAVIDLRSSGRSALSVADALGMRGVDIEMADFRRLVLINALDQPREDLTRFSEILAEILPGLPLEHRSGTLRLQSRIEELLARPRKPVRPRAALTQGLRASSVREEEALSGLSRGKRLIAASSISPYPPGIPLFYPGEELTEEDLRLLSLLLSEGLVIPTCEEGYFPILIQ